MSAELQTQIVTTKVSMKDVIDMVILEEEDKIDKSIEVSKCLIDENQKKQEKLKKGFVVSVASKIHRKTGLSPLNENYNEYFSNIPPIVELTIQYKEGKLLVKEDLTDSFKNKLKKLKDEHDHLLRERSKLFQERDKLKQRSRQLRAIFIRQLLEQSEDGKTFLKQLKEARKVIIPQLNPGV